MSKALMNLVKNRDFSSVIKKLAKKENVSAKELAYGIATGTCVIPLNNTKKITNPCAIGKNLSTKVNVNLGTSTDKTSLKTELEKLKLAIALGTDTVMDLSIGGDLRAIRRAIIENSSVPVGTVPIYEAAMNVQKKRKTFLKLEKDDILDTLETQARDGVDFFTVHCGINRTSLEVFLKNRRILDVVSRGGALLINWMRTNKKENPFFEYFDDCLDIAKRYNITLSLGDGMRPGSILDATDKTQISELEELGKLTQRAQAAGVQVIIEGPGHVPLNQIQKNIELQKLICHGAPFYVLGPLVTDVGVGYDHITGAIGGALAATYGADFLCFLTPAEHIRHPSLEDAREGLVASKIAAHAADIAKGLKNATLWDKQMSEARKKRDWPRQIQLAIDPWKAEKYKASSHPKVKNVCTMCGEFCSIKLIDECLTKHR